MISIQIRHKRHKISHIQIWHQDPNVLAEKNILFCHIDHAFPELREPRHRILRYVLLKMLDGKLILSLVLKIFIKNIYFHWRHCNPGHRDMGRVVFLPRPEIIYINTPFSLPRPEVIYIYMGLVDFSPEWRQWSYGKTHFLMLRNIFLLVKKFFRWHFLNILFNNSLAIKPIMMSYEKFRLDLLSRFKVMHGTANLT